MPVGTWRIAESAGAEAGSQTGVFDADRNACSADKVLLATQGFCREQLELKHRYAMALHTDEPHPHVNVVVKAVGEQGERLNIRKATLREWREEFARHLRRVGVAANATPRFVRGETRPRKSDGISRAARRGASIHMRDRAEAAAIALRAADPAGDPAKLRIRERRRDLERGWLATGDALRSQVAGVNYFFRWRQLFLPILSLHHWSTFAQSDAKGVRSSGSEISARLRSKPNA